MIKNMSILKKLLIMGAFSIFGLILVGIIGFLNTKSLSLASKNVITNVLPAIQKTTLLAMHHDGLVGIVYKAYYVGPKSKTEEKIEISKEFNETKKDFNHLLLEIKAFQLSEKVNAFLVQIQPDIENYVNIGEELVELGLNSKKTEFENKIPQFEINFKKLEGELENLANLIQAESDSTQSNIEEQTKKSTWSNIAITFLVILLTGVLGGWIAKELFATLKRVVGALRNEVTGVSDGTEDIQNSAMDISKIIGGQSASLTETAAAIEEIKAMSDKTSENSVKSKSVAEKNSKDCEEGELSLKKLLYSLEDIKNANQGLVDIFNENSLRIKEMSSLIQEIGSQTRVINDIVFQTKLLSLNAAAEAARAGEHGKGFSVVAEEVGNLAEMSGQAAKQISLRLTDSINYVDNLVSDMEKKIKEKIEINQRALNESKEVAENCRKSFSNSVLGAKQVSELVSNISEAASEQNTGISEITNAISMLEQSNQESVDIVSKNFEAVTEFKNKSKELINLSKDLENLLYGQKHSEKDLNSANGSIDNQLTQLAS